MCGRSLLTIGKVSILPTVIADELDRQVCVWEGVVGSEGGPGLAHAAPFIPTDIGGKARS